ncbi:MAG: hypothetical protein QM831_28535 [Kofleriaceae bacterium]
MKKIILSAVALALMGGAAMADRGHGGGARQGGVSVHTTGGGRAVVHERGGYNGGYNGGYHGGGGWHGGVVVHNNYPARREFHTYGHARANIYVERPFIREHYYHYGYRPRLIVENYGPREGYLWIHGEWAWNGYEWIWAPGHYEPDPAFVEVY